MDKNILSQYWDIRARLKLLYIRRDKNQKRLDKLNQTGYFVTDAVSKGRRGKKSLGTVMLAGFPHPEWDKVTREIRAQDFILAMQEQKLLELQTSAEEYISGIEDIEVQNLMTLYYMEDLNWVQVAHWMNELYPKKKGAHTADSCRCKHERFLEKSCKTTVTTVFR